jgi:hypothetical protein
LSDEQLVGAIHHIDEDLDDDDWDDDYKSFMDDSDRMEDLLGEAWRRWGCLFPLVVGVGIACAFIFGDYFLNYDWHDLISSMIPLGPLDQAYHYGFSYLDWGGPAKLAGTAGLALVAPTVGVVIASRLASSKNCDEERAAVAAAQARLAAAQQQVATLQSAQAAAAAADQKVAAAQSAAAAADAAGGAQPWSLDADVTDMNDGSTTHYHREGTGYRDTPARQQAQGPHADAAAAQSAAQAARGAYDALGGDAALAQAQQAVTDAQAQLSSAAAALAACEGASDGSNGGTSGGAATGGPSTASSTTGSSDAPSTQEKPKDPPPPPPPPPPTTTTTTSSTTDGCKDGETRKSTLCSSEVDLYILSSAQLCIDGAYLFSDDDVQKALDGLDAAKSTIDVAVGLVGAVTDPVGSILGTLGVPSFDTITNAPTDATIDALGRLAKKFESKRKVGDWTLLCPLQHYRVSCEQTEQCKNGRWVASRTMTYQKVGAPRMVSSPSVAVVDPAKESSRVMTQLSNYFLGRNTTAAKTIEKCAKMCGE